MPHDPRRRAEQPGDTDAHDATLDSVAGGGQKQAAWRLPGERYRVVDEIARGGMGVVLRAVDTDIERTLALKVMLGSPNELQQQRFLDEARITGQLQHPGIPPVHEIGRLTDGLPFFSMKLIEGHTLAELLRERKSPQDDLPRLLMVFEQVAQTVAYAHSLGIIHRDLKPANIMVGAFGEVQVMDWGLAKRLADRQPPAKGIERPAAETVTRPLAETIDPTPSQTDADSRTLAGQIMGTLAYMPPEQALGEIGQLDQRADVFGLGAILCVILTGQPPYASKDHAKLYQMASQGLLDPCFARLDASGADQQLVALTRRCLARMPDDRPRDAGEVSRVVTEYLETVQQRLKQTEIERAEALTRAAEEQKRREVEQAKARAERHKRLITLALAASVLLLLTGAGLAISWYQRDLARQSLAQSELTARAKRLNDEVLSTLDVARQQRDDLHARLSDPSTVPELLSDINQWASAIGAARTAWQRADTLANSDEKLLRKDVADRLAELDVALQADQQDFALARRLDAIRQSADLVIEGKYDPRRAAAEYEKAFREAGYDVESGEFDAVAKRIRQSAIRYALVAAMDDWALHDSRPALIVAQRADDPDPWRQRLRHQLTMEDWGPLEQLAEEVDLARQSPQIIDALARALSYTDIDPAPLLRRALIQYPQDYNLHFLLGNHAADPLEEIGSYRAALAVRPDSAPAFLNLSICMMDAGDLEQAVALCRKAIDLDPSFNKPYLQLSVLLDALGDPDGAIASCRKAIDVDPNYINARNHLALALMNRGDLEGAEKICRETIAIDKNHSFAYVNLGLALANGGDLDGAMVEFQKAIDLDPKNAKAYQNMGQALLVQGDVEGAITYSRTAIEVDPQEVHAYVTLGEALASQGDLKGAVTNFQKAADLDPDNVKLHQNIGHALVLAGDPDAAIAHCRKAIELNPDSSYAYFNLGLALHAKGDLEGALANFDKAIGIDPNYVEAHANRAAALRDQGNLEGAIAAYQTAIGIAPRDATLHYNLGIVRNRMGDLDGAVASYREAIAIDPQYAEVHCNLADVLKRQGKFDEALQSIRRGHELGSKRKNWKYPTAQWVARAERRVELDRKLLAVLAGRQEPADARERLEMAPLLYYKRDFANAARFYAEAFKALPQLADDVRSGIRYNAACAAAQAATLPGDDRLTEVQRQAWRQQSRAWLDANLDAWKVVLEKEPRAAAFIQGRLRSWQADPALAGVRDRSALAGLPAEEQAAWQRLWADARDLLEHCEATGM